MNSLNTQNTTSQNNNHCINSNNSNNQYHNQDNKPPTPTKQIQYFSHILEAFIIFINEFNIPTSAYNLLLALLAYAGKRTTFFAAHLTLYPFIHNYKNPKSVKPINIDSARKNVWRHLTDTEAWMDQIGITLFTRIVRDKQNPTDKYNASEYDITILVNILIEIITEAHATKHLFEFNIGKALQATAIKKANELKESATPKHIIEKNTIKKQLTLTQQLDKTFSLAQSLMIKFKAEELASHTNKEEIGKTLEAKCLSFFNFACNFIDNLTQPKDPNFDSSQIDEICPTYQDHIFNYSYSVTDVSHVPPECERDEDFLSKEEIVPDGLDQIEVNESMGYVADLSHVLPESESNEEFLSKEESLPDGLDQIEVNESVGYVTNLSGVPDVNEQVVETFTVTIFDNQYEKLGTEVDLTLRDFVEHIGMNAPVVITPKSDSDADFLKAKQKNKGFCPVTFVSDPAGRQDDSVESLSMICFDYDDADFRVDLNPIVRLGYRGFIYTSYRHTDINHRFRLGFVLKEPIPAKYYKLLWDKLFSILGREVGTEGTTITCNIDTSCFNPSRLWYLPAIKSKDASYYLEIFDSEGFELLDWRSLIEQEIIDFDASIQNLFQIPTPNDNTTVEEPQTVEKKNKKNVTLSSFVPKSYVIGADKPNIPGYYWPSMLKALRDKAGNRSAADSSWCYWCAKFGIPEAVAAIGLLEVSEKASQKANNPYGNGRYYHLDTVREAYIFYRGKHNK